MRRSRWLVNGTLLLILLGAGLILGARWQSRSGFVDSDQMAHDEGKELAIEPGSPVGQTFVARHAGLSGIEFYLQPEHSNPVSLTLHLREDTQSTTDVATASLTLPAQAEPGFYRFDFRPVDSSHARYYYAFLETTSAGTGLGIAPGKTYLDGAAYQQHQPLDAQTSFRLVYAPTPMLLDIAGAIVGWTGLLAISLLLFVVPGWAVVSWLLPDARLAWAELIGLAVGVSIALYATILLWARTVGLSPGSALVWLLVILGLVLVVWRHRNWRPQSLRQDAQTWTRSGDMWPDLTLIFVLLLVFVVRLLVVRTMEAGLWADSYEHTVMTQLMLDYKGLFDSWEPYSPYQSLTVHFGFSTASAALAWMTGKTSTEAVLLTGQLMNGFAALTLYPLAVRLAKGNRWAGMGAVLVAGILSPMPAFYVNWGRFAQLTGQALMPVALWLTWEAVERRGAPWRAAAIAGLAVSGMALAYYRMPFYYAAFILTWLLGWGVPHWRSSGRHWLNGLSRLLLVGGIALLLLLPLAFRLAGGQLAAGLGAGISKGAPINAVLAEYRFWREIELYLPIPLLISAAIALVLSIVRRAWAVAAIGLWILILAALPAGRLIHLPGANYMQSFSTLIFLYIPVSLLLGWLVGLISVPTVRVGKTVALSLALVVLALWASWGQIKIVDPARILVTRPDMQAMEWIQQNTAKDSLFLVEGYFYQGYSAIGSDAGWWIPLLAGRSNNMPPQYALLSEKPTEPGYSRAVVDLVVLLGDTTPGTAEGIESLCDWGFTHIYIGQGQGEVGYPWTALFSEQDLESSPAFSQVYERDLVSIYAIDPDVCRRAP
jgi:hypothetical protein